MKIFRKITWETMKQNRMRTAVTIIGVILSATLFTAVTVFCSSLASFLEKTYIYNSGNYHLAAEWVDAETKDACLADPDTELMSSAMVLGYAEIGSSNPDKPYLYVEAADAVFYREMPVHLTAGRIPENGGEILLPDHLYTNGGVSFEIGDTLTLQTGERVIVGAEEEKLGQYNPYLGEEEQLTDLTEETYTVCGFYERPQFEDYAACGYTALTGMEEGEKQPADAIYDVYVRLVNPAKNLERYQTEYFYDYSVTYNNDLLMFSGMFVFGNFSLFFFGMVVFFVGLIFVGSVSLIYSAFSISVSERTRQFGLLASVGATKQQIARMVWQESLIVAAVGIPGGIAVGIAGIGITLRLLGDRFDALIASPYQMTLAVSWKAIGLAVVIALFTVLVSALIPAMRATMVHPIDAIRQNQDIRIRSRDVKTRPSFYRFFGLEGMLGKKYFLRSRKKYRNTVISLTFSVILFITASSYGLYLKDSVTESAGTSNYDVSYMGIPAGTEVPEEELRSAAGVAQMAWSSTEYRECILDREETSGSYQDYMQEMETLVQDQGDGIAYDPRPADVGGQYVLPVSIYYLDEATYADFVRDQGLDEATYLQDGEVPAIVMNRGSSTVYVDGERFSFGFDYLARGLDTLRLAAEPPKIDGYTAILTNWCPADTVETAGDTAVLSGQGKDGREYVFCDQYVRDEESNACEYDENGVILGARNIPAQLERVEVGACVEERPLGVPSGEVLSLIYPYHMMPEEEREENPPVCYFVAEDHEQMLDSIQAVFEEHGLRTGEDSLQDLLAAEENARNLVMIIHVFSYGFIILLSLISVANVFHAISTNISLRRRDFAMLKSVGMTQKSLLRMLKFECLIYGARALTWGLPIGFILGLAVFRIVGTVYSERFYLPWQPYVIVVVCVFAVVFLSMRYAVRRVRTENPIEALKEEN